MKGALLNPPDIDLDSHDFGFGYCTNVHSGRDLDTALMQIDRFAVPVRDQVCPSGRLPIGLWFSQSAADSLLDQDRCQWLKSWLDQRAMCAYTFNGFPQGDFHQPVVKHAVYEPTWMCPSRAEYTQRLAIILDRILPEGQAGSISTMPLGWPYAPWHAENYRLAADYLIATARTLAELSQRRGCELVLAIEPEPGCVLETADDVVNFFEHYLFRGPESELARRHLTVCHDICHSGVMFESQQRVLEKYVSAGIRVGKVQVSSAVHVPWDQVRDQPERRQQMLDQLRGFNEPKYLHQTTRCGPEGLLVDSREDLGLAIADWDSNEALQFPWRVHFHLPIFVRHFGQLSTTQQDIFSACQFLEQNQSKDISGSQWFTGHYEVETYAWTVLPVELQLDDLASGIAKELEFFKSILQDVRNTCPTR